MRFKDRKWERRRRLNFETRPVPHRAQRFGIRIEFSGERNGGEERTNRPYAFLARQHRKHSEIKREKRRMLTYSGEHIQKGQTCNSKMLFFSALRKCYFSQVRKRENEVQ